jgi:hypothetical protein
LSDPSTLLQGNGAGLVRERNLAAAVQRALERLYLLDRVADVEEFVEHAGRGERECLLVREAEDGALEMSVRVPKLARRAFDVTRDADLDPLCQIIEGVSHFVYLAHRARAGREATHLELEVQAEVDKYVILAASLDPFDPPTSARLRARLYELVSFTHEKDSTLGQRYRVANDLASRYTWRLEREYVTQGRYDGMRAELRRFYRMGQEDKLRVGRAA